MQALKEENCTLKMIQGNDYESSEYEEISDDSLNEFWHKEAHELEEERKNIKNQGNKLPACLNKETDMTMDKKLEEYLSVHSVNLTGKIREFVEKSQTQKLSSEDAVSSLGLVGFERK